MAQNRSSRAKRNVKVDPEGLVYIKASFNNIIISITNKKGEVISWASAGKAGFRGSKNAEKSKTEDKKDLKAVG